MDKNLAEQQYQLAISKAQDKYARALEAAYKKDQKKISLHMKMLNDQMLEIKSKYQAAIEPLIQEYIKSTRQAEEEYEKEVKLAHEAMDACLNAIETVGDSK